MSVKWFYTWTRKNREYIIPCAALHTTQDVTYLSLIASCTGFFHRTEECQCTWCSHGSYSIPTIIFVVLQRMFLSSNISLWRWGDLCLSLYAVLNNVSNVKSYNGIMTFSGLFSILFQWSLAFASASLTATEHWDWRFRSNIYYKILLVGVNGQLKGHNFICKIRVVSSVHHFHLSTFNFTCHFILQSLTLIRYFCQPSHSALVLSPAMKNFASSLVFVMPLFISSFTLFTSMLNSPHAHSDLSSNPLVTSLHCPHAFQPFTQTFSFKQLISNTRTSFPWTFLQENLLKTFRDCQM